MGVKKGQYRTEEVFRSGKPKPPSNHIQPLRVTVHYKLMPSKLGELGGWTGLGGGGITLIEDQEFQQTKTERLAALRHV